MSPGKVGEHAAGIQEAVSAARHRQHSGLCVLDVTVAVPSSQGVDTCTLFMRYC